MIRSLIGIWTICFCSCCQTQDTIVFKQQNAVWIQSKFFRGYAPTSGEKLEIRELSSLAGTLKNHQIKYAYIFSGPYGEDGHIPEYAFSQRAIETVEFLKETTPEVMVLPWLGGVQDRTVNLWDSAWCRNALEDTRRLIEVLGVPGVHIDFEYIIRGDPFLDKDLKPEMENGIRDYGQKVNDFHKKLGKLLPDAFISSVVAAPSEGTKPWKRKPEMDELRGLLPSIDQLSFLYYDTGINDQEVFASNCIELIDYIMTLSSEFSSVQFLIGIGTFINTPHLHKFRNLTIESIPNTLNTIKKSIQNNNPENHPVIDGIAIFSDWTTTPNEWHQFYENWIKKEE